MDAEILAGLVRRLYPSFNTHSFNNRLKLQKFFFFLRTFGLDLGYDFRLYIRGPYSAELARDSFQVSDWEKVQPVKFQTEDQEQKFLECLALLEPYKDNIEWLELNATLLLLKEISPQQEITALIKTISQIKPQYNEADIRSAYAILKEHGRI